ncbi:hypothetical protein DFH08DRAFT_1012110 [Mycena albidolilacea]|uniref:Uncharacterized protein n=1 Tax=Mycena albidolilacea TaxID=1033008 RepID=A0AAD6ZVJ6_9AGAR|nr:hypothetical protein DFH08DRAFT_1012110 [Mycena albidolilacea]
MQAKFASLSIVLSVLFVSQLVGAVPKIDCSLVRCAAVECPLSETAQIKPGTCCPTCVPCGKVNCPLIACYPTWQLLPDLCSSSRLFCCSVPRLLTFFNSPKNTIVFIPPGQCCPTCKPKPDCKDVFCPQCVGVIEPGNCCPTCGLGADIAKAEK